MTIRAISEFVDYYNNNRYHESLHNLTPANVFFGRSKEIISMRELVKEQTLKLRRHLNRGKNIKDLLLDYEQCLS